jgi:hypothetical protein
VIFEAIDRLARCGSPALWQRVHACLVILYFINLPLFIWWAATLNEKALLVQLGGLTVLTAIESSMAGLHASAVQEKQEEEQH